MVFVGGNSAKVGSSSRWVVVAGPVVVWRRNFGHRCVGEDEGLTGGVEVERGGGSLGPQASGGDHFVVDGGDVVGSVVSEARIVAGVWPKV